MSEFQKEELSLEETNKLRISLGLKPLVADNPPTPSKLEGEALAAKNFQDKQQRERRQREDAELKQRLAKAQAKRDAARRLKGPTLADLHPAESSSSPSALSSKDTLKWIKESQKRANEHAARRPKQLDEYEARQQAEYRESDLAGLRVGHHADEFGQGEERILTLRDAGVLDQADDELMDAALDQAERDKKNIERKKGAKEYNGLDDDKVVTGRKRGVLSKYDADLAQADLVDADQAGFRLGANVSAAHRRARLRAEAEQEARLANKQLLSLDYAKNQEVSDYLQEGDIGFKKPKAKKRRKSTKVKISLDDDDDVAAGPSAAPDTQLADVEMQDTKIVTKPLRRQETDNFVDDDELQSSLAKARRLKAKRTFSKMTPEMIAKNLAAQKAAKEAERAANSGTSGAAATASLSNGAAPSNGANEGSSAEAGLTFDETSEFVRAIRERPLEAETRTRARAVKRESRTPALGEEDGVRVKREESADVPMQELEAIPVQAQVEVEDDTVATAVKEEREEGEALATVKTEEPDVDEAEPVIGRGMASTLSFLRQQGMLSTNNDASLREREEQQRKYDAWLAARRLEEAQREAERAASKASGSSLDQSSREAANRHRELEEARLAQDRFRDYKPDVEIKYHDEFGRDLDPKEAWKHLSHVFHGKKPGTKKMEKRLKKIEDEKKRERMAAGDTPTGMMSAFQKRGERTGKAHMVLSVGNRGSAPQENDLLDGKTKAGIQLKKPAKAIAKKGGTQVLGLSMSASGVSSVIADAEGMATTTKTSGGGGGWARIGSATPAPWTSGFKPVLSASQSGENSTEATPAAPSGTGFRLAFSGVKRKAEGQ